MPASELDNPFWSSLRSRHRDMALRVGDVARYPAEFAPFLGVADAGVDVSEAIASLVAPDESVYLLGVALHIPAGWRIEAFSDLAQMVCTMQMPVIDGPEVIELSDAHRTDVLALTALVYPHYFRPRTMDMGRYFGIYMPDERGNGRLAAIIGERLGTDAYQEISAVCTHPISTAVATRAGCSPCVERQPHARPHAFPACQPSEPSRDAVVRTDRLPPLPRHRLLVAAPRVRRCCMHQLSTNVFNRANDLSHWLETSSI